MDPSMMLQPPASLLINATIEIAVAAGITFGFVAIECASNWDRDFAMLRDFRWANLCYFAARYIGVATMSTYLALDRIGTNASGCDFTFKFGQILSAFLFLSCASIFSMRVAALYNNSLKVLLPLAAYALAIFAYTIYAAIAFLDATQSPFGIVVCNCAVTNGNLGLIYFLDGSFDIIILILTLVALFRKVPLGSRLKTLLIGDQVLYVVAVSALYFVAGICYYQSNKVAPFIVSLIVLSLSSVLVCRLFLRLRDFGNTIAAGAKNTPAAPPTVGPFGARQRPSSADAYDMSLPPSTKNSPEKGTAPAVWINQSRSTVISPPTDHPAHLHDDQLYIIGKGSHPPSLTMSRDESDIMAEHA